MGRRAVRPWSRVLALCCVGLLACSELPFSPESETLPITLDRTSVSRRPETPGSEVRVAAITYDLANPGTTAIVLPACIGPDGVRPPILRYVDRWNAEDEEWQVELFPFCEWPTTVEVAPGTSIRDAMVFYQPGIYRLRVPYTTAGGEASGEAAATSAAFRVR
jgi:hypothetical protein